MRINFDIAYNALEEVAHLMCDPETLEQLTEDQMYFRNKLLDLCRQVTEEEEIVFFNDESVFDREWQ